MSNNDNVATKRIPVTEETWKDLHELRKPGQTFGQLINLMILVYKSHDGKFIPWDEAKKELGLKK